MWRLLVVLALCGASLVQGENHAVSCSNITTVQNVSFTELQGTWIGRKKLHWDRIVDPEGSMCVIDEISATSKTSLKLDTKIHYRWENQKGSVETEHLEFNIVGDDKGRWSLDNNDTDNQAIEILVLSTDPSSYLVTAWCQPKRWYLQGNFKYDGTGERILRTVYIFARRQESGDSGNLSEENLAKIIDDTVKTLGLESYNQEEKHETDC